MNENEVKLQEEVKLMRKELKKAMNKPVQSSSGMESIDVIDLLYNLFSCHEDITSGNLEDIKIKLIYQMHRTIELFDKSDKTMTKKLFQLQEMINSLNLEELKFLQAKKDVIISSKKFVG